MLLPRQALNLLRALRPEKSNADALDGIEGGCEGGHPPAGRNAMKNSIVPPPGVSAAAELLPESFTLRETIARIALGDHTHRLQPDYSDTWSRMAGLDPTSVEGKRRWEEWNQGAIKLDRQINAAIALFLRALGNGVLTIAGDLVEDGSPTSEIDTVRHDPIPPDTLKLPAEIPPEWLENRGGWLLFRERTVRGVPQYRRYTNISIQAAGVTLGMLGTAEKAVIEKRGLVTDRTGAQGRPTSRHLMLAEFQRRVAADTVCLSLRV